jgi:hypothetical protein
MHGFKRIDALDPSRGMLEVAKKKKLYRCYTCSYIRACITTVQFLFLCNNNWFSYHSDLLRRHFQCQSMYNNGTVSCSYLENGVLTDRNGKKTNYCSKEKETVPLLYILLPGK